MTVGLTLATAAAVIAHGAGAGIEVEPSTVTAGGTVTLVGENLEPNDERVLVLVGADLTLDLGMVTTDEMGEFSLEVVIPAHLPAAVYEFQAIGDETLTVQLNVTAGAGSEPGPSTAPGSEPPPRQRSSLEVAAILLTAAAAAAVGTFFVLRAERLGGRPA